MAPSSVAPYRAALEADAKEVLAESAAYMGTLTAASDALARLGVRPDVDDNKYTHLNLAAAAAAHAQLEEALTTRGEAFEEHARRAEETAARAAALGEAARAYLASARDVLLTASGQSPSGGVNNKKKQSTFLSAINPLSWGRSSSSRAGKKKKGTVAAANGGDDDDDDSVDDDALSSTVAAIRAAWDGGAALKAALARAEEAAHACASHHHHHQQQQQQQQQYQAGDVGGVVLEAVSHRLRYGAGDGFLAVKAGASHSLYSCVFVFVHHSLDLGRFNRGMEWQRCGRVQQWSGAIKKEKIK